MNDGITVPLEHTGDIYVEVTVCTARSHYGKGAVPYDQIDAWMKDRWA